MPRPKRRFKRRCLRARKMKMSVNDYKFLGEHSEHQYIIFNYCLSIKSAVLTNSDFLLFFYNCAEAEKSSRETEGNCGRVGRYYSCHVAYTDGNHYTGGKNPNQFSFDG